MHSMLVGSKVLSEGFGMLRVAESIVENETIFSNPPVPEFELDRLF